MSSVALQTVRDFAAVSTQNTVAAGSGDAPRDRLKVQLTAALIDNPPGPSAGANVNVTVTNSVGRLTVENLGGTPLTVHRFTVTDATNMGYGIPHNLTRDQAAEVLSIACSLADHSVLFWGAQHSNFPHLWNSVNFRRLQTLRKPRRGQSPLSGTLFGWWKAK